MGKLQKTLSLWTPETSYRTDNPVKPLRGIVQSTQKRGTCVILPSNSRIKAAIKWTTPRGFTSLENNDNLASYCSLVLIPPQCI
jgi:hypothetical protein